MAELGATFLNARDVNASATGIGMPSSNFGNYTILYASFLRTDFVAFAAVEKYQYLAPASPVQPLFYEMRGRDLDCPTLTYRYWRVSGSPDLTGLSYPGPKCGATPLSEITVLETSNAT